jgi:putative transposase
VEPAIHVALRIRATEVLDVFADLMQMCGVPTHIRSDDGPEVVAVTLRGWLGRVGAGASNIMPAPRGRAALANRSTASCATSC